MALLVIFLCGLEIAFGHFHRAHDPVRFGIVGIELQGAVRDPLAFVIVEIRQARLPRKLAWRKAGRNSDRLRWRDRTI